jgi:hypothetical protein
MGSLRARSELGAQIGMTLGRCDLIFFTIMQESGELSFDDEVIELTPRTT